jgi:hypothetical protein
MTKYELGDKIELHANFNYETNCALCAKPLGSKFVELCTGDLNELITPAEYNARAMRNEFVATLPIGSTCVKRVAASAVSA